MRARGEVSGVCAVCVGMAAILKKEQNVDSAARTNTNTSTFPFFCSCRLFYCHILSLFQRLYVLF